MIGRRAGESRGIAGKDFVPEGAQTVAEDSAHVRMPAGAAYDFRDRVGVDVADCELIKVGREAAARPGMSQRRKLEAGSGDDGDREAGR